MAKQQCDKALGIATHDMNPAPLSVVFLTVGTPFPHGLASSSRLRLMARSLAEQGADLCVLIMLGTETLGAVTANREVKGIYHGVSFEYMSRTVLRPWSAIGRQFQKIIGLVVTVRTLSQLHQQDRLHVLVLYTRDLRVIAAASRLCRRWRVPAVLELCEWPLAQVATRGGNRRQAERFCTHAFDYVDGVVAISRRLEEEVWRYNRSSGRSLPVLRLPILVDVAPGLNTGQAQQPPCAVYCAALNYRKALTAVLDAWCVLRQRSAGIRLMILAGRSPPHDVAVLHALIHERQLAEVVEVRGYLPDRELAQVLRSALVLLAPLPDDAQSAYRFPTKIGEYLTSGRPVLTTPVGEVTEFLQDDVSAFFAADLAPVTLADRIRQLADDPETADRVGAAGRRVAVERFHFTRHGAGLLEFLRTLATDSRGNAA